MELIRAFFFVCVVDILSLISLQEIGLGDSPHDAIESIRKKHKIVGLVGGSFGANQETQIVATGLAKAFSKDELLPTDKIHLGSCTKSMTATLVGILVDEGRLNWNSTLGELFADETDLVGSDWANVTVASLMHHTSGAPANAPWREFDQKGMSLVQQRRSVLRWLAKTKRTNHPAYLYSNIGYVLLGHMIEQRTSKSWETVIRERLFEPLEMHSAGFGPPSRSSTSRAMGHIAMVGVPMAVELDNPPVLGPAGTVHATMEDWSKYLKLHLSEFWQSPTLRISSETMSFLHTAKPQEKYAGGWVCESRDWANGQVLWHNGSNTYWYCVVFLAVKQQRGFFAASNVGMSSNKACDEALQWFIRHNPYKSNDN